MSKKRGWALSTAPPPALAATCRPRSPRRPTRAARARVWRPRGGAPAAREACDGAAPGAKRVHGGARIALQSKEHTLTGLVNAVLVAHDLPELGANLVAALAGLEEGGRVGRGGRWHPAFLGAGSFFWPSRRLASHHLPPPLGWAGRGTYLDGHDLAHGGAGNEGRARVVEREEEK